MSLPFLKQQKPQSGIAIEFRKPDENKEPLDNTDHEMEAVAKDLLSSIRGDNFKLLAKALRAAFEIADASPHVEGEHLNESEEE